jgi:PAS domain S-box-containing protein
MEVLKAQLQRQERLMREAQKLARFGSWEGDLITDDVTWSEEMYRIFGLPVGTPLKWADVCSMILPEDRPAAAERFERAVAADGSVAGTYRIRRPDGEVATLHGWLEVIRDPAGKPVRVIGATQDITEQVRAEQAARASAERCRRVVENSPDVIVRTDREGRVLFGNPAFEKGIGLPLAQIVGKTFPEIGFDRGFAPWEALRARAIDEGCEVADLIQVPTPEGPRHLDVRMIPERNAAGEIESLLSISRDVSERVRLASQLRRSECQLKEAQALARLGSWEWDPRTDEHFWSDEYYRLLGYEPGEVAPCGAIVQAAIHPEERPLFLQSLASFYDIKEPTRFESEYRVVLPDGRVRYLHCHGEVLFDAAGRPARVLGTNQDVTEQRLAEQALRDSEARFRQLAEASFEGIAIHEQGRILEVNRVLADMFGYTMDELIGRSVLELAAPESRGEIVSRIAANVEMPYEATGLRKDGTTFPGELYAKQIPYQGRMVRVTAVRDISERKRAEAELTAMNRELQRLSRLKDEFLSTISHELRTPLAAIQNASAILGKRKAGPLNDMQAHFVAIVSDHVKRLHRLVDDVLDFQKLEEGVMNFRPTHLDLRPVVLEVVNSYATVFAVRGIAVTVDLPSHPLNGRVDRDKITQLLLNLLSNAAKFTPEGGRVTVVGAVERDEIHLRVSDTGPGIAEGDRDRIFQKFVQLDGSLTRQVGGTGLGLAICKRIVEDGHEGRIWADGGPGEGTTIHIALPRCELQDGAA